MTNSIFSFLVPSGVTNWIPDVDKEDGSYLSISLLSSGVLRIKANQPGFIFLAKHFILMGLLDGCYGLHEHLVAEDGELAIPRESGDLHELLIRNLDHDLHPSVSQKFTDNMKNFSWEIPDCTFDQFLEQANAEDLRIQIFVNSPNCVEFKGTKDSLVYFAKLLLLISNSSYDIEPSKYTLPPSESDGFTWGDSDYLTTVTLQLA